MEQQKQQQPHIQSRILRNIELNKQINKKPLFKRLSQYPIQKYQIKTIMKKYSLETTSSNNLQVEHNCLTNKYLTQQELNFSNVQLFDSNILKKKNTGVLIQRQGNNKYSLKNIDIDIGLSSFQLIKVPQKFSSVSLSELKMIDFPVLGYSINELIGFSAEILISQQYCSSNYNKKQIEEFVKNIALNYKSISYHNFSHAFSLMQLNFECMQMIPSFKNKFTSEERFYFMIAGLSHDINHSGTNNMFEINKNSSLAVSYNYQSVLQNMHITTLWQILKENPQFDFLQKSSNPNQARSIITRLILSTDMSIHFQKIEVLKDRRNKNNINLGQFEDKMFMMEQLFHSCDLGNPTLQYTSYISWAALLSYQFNQQFKLEKNLNIQETAYLQYKNIRCFYQDQITFIGKVVQPLWRQLSLNFSELIIFQNKIQENLETLKQKHKQQIQKV